MNECDHVKFGYAIEEGYLNNRIHIMRWLDWNKPRTTIDFTRDWLRECVQYASHCMYTNNNGTSANLSVSFVTSFRCSSSLDMYSKSMCWPVSVCMAVTFMHYTYAYRKIYANFIKDVREYWYWVFFQMQQKTFKMVKDDEWTKNKVKNNSEMAKKNNCMWQQNEMYNTYERKCVRLSVNYIHYTRICDLNKKSNFNFNFNNLYRYLIKPTTSTNWRAIERRRKWKENRCGLVAKIRSSNSKIVWILFSVFRNFENIAQKSMKMQ